MNKQTYIVNDWLIDFYSGFLVHQLSGDKKYLGKYQIKLLELLLKDIGKVVSRDDLINSIWEKRVIGHNSLPNAVHTLRVALGDDKKQQRIIQTIPKRGYLLDSAYCLISENNALTPQNNKNSDNEKGIMIPAAEINQEHNKLDVIKNGMSLLAAIHNNNEVSLSEEENESALDSTPIISKHERQYNLSPRGNGMAISIKNWRFFKKHPYLLGLTLIIILSGLIVLINAIYKESSLTLHAEELEQHAYSNIRLFQLKEAHEKVNNSDNLYEMLKETLHQLDKSIKIKNIHINVYYYLSLYRLNYTFSVENPCKKKQQLSMTINHWRLNNKILNKLIQQEMERRINELGTCNN